MSVTRMLAAAANYWEYPNSPVDANGDPIDPSGLPVVFAAVDPGLAVADTWAGIVTQAADTATGSWEGPDDSGVYVARVLVSGPGGGGDLVLTVGDWRMVCQITSTPERPVDDTGTLRLI